MIQEEAQPHAFAFALCADHVHAVIPVAGADERQAAFAETQTFHDGAHTVLVKIGRVFRVAGHIVIRVLFGIHRAAVEEVHVLLQHSGVARGQDIATDRQRQPQVVVGTVRAHAAIGCGMPPMLDIAFAELMRRTAQQVLPHQCGSGMDQRHRVLQLIAETECAA